jgi:hypothetical protein
MNKGDELPDDPLTVMVKEKVRGVLCAGWGVWSWVWVCCYEPASLTSHETHRNDDG